MMLRNPWLPGYTAPDDGSVVVFCFPFAGGTAAAFREWRLSGHPGVRFQPVELPGRASRLMEPASRQMSELTRAFLGDCADELARQDYALFGHSMGGAICAHLAGELAARRLRAPQRLYLSGAALSSKPSAKPLHLLPDDDLIRKLRGFGGTPPEVLDNRPLMELLLPTLRCDFALVDSCPPPTALTTPVTVFSGAQDTLAPPDHMRRWDQLAPLGFRQVVLPGGHFFIHAQGGRIRQEVVVDLRVRRAASFA
jgi:medium-chain acyl-[acyl-carrier-protein] hydrolase